MKLFWKVFLLLLSTLVMTATLSGWLSQKWLAENQQIEKQLQILATLGETAVGLYHEGGIRSYRQWHRHAMRDLQIHGGLLDANGNSMHHRPMPPELRELTDQVVAQQKRINLIQPPLLAVAIPISYQSQRYIWIAAKRLPPQSMRQGSRQTLFVLITSELFAIILISLLLTRMFTSPIRILQHTTKQLGSGALDACTDVSVASRKDELGELAISID